jgi:hypothetical protein
LHVGCIPLRDDDQRPSQLAQQITGIDIHIPAGTISFSAPQPGAIPDMLKNLPTDLLEAVSFPS